MQRFQRLPLPSLNRDGANPGQATAVLVKLAPKPLGEDIVEPLTQGAERDHRTGFALQVVASPIRGTDPE
jgi:hypothetical protein